MHSASPDHLPGSLRSLENLAWVRIATGVAAVGYLLVALAVRLLDSGPFAGLQNAVTAAICGIAFAYSKRAPKRAAMLALISIWLELTLTLFKLGQIEVTSTLVFPVLAAALGLIFGERWAMVGGLAICVTIPAASVAGRLAQGEPALRAGDLLTLVVVEVIVLSTAVFCRTVLQSFRNAWRQTEEARRRFAELLEHAPEGLLEVDQNGRIRESNRVARQILGRSADALVGSNLREILGSGGDMGDIAWSEISAGHPRVVDLEDAAGNGRTLELTGRCPDEGAATRLLGLRDVTERRRAQERQVLTQRLETVGRLAAGVAHDFNNLLTAIGGNASLLKLHRDREVTRLATDIGVAHERAAALVRQLSVYARHEIRQMERLDLEGEIREWMPLLQGLTRKQCVLRLGCVGSAQVIGDRGLVEQILLNLIANARDAEPVDRTIDVRLSALAHAAAQAVGSTLTAERQVCLEVADRGCGMSVEVQARLFEPFFTTKPIGEGTGLGLATVNSIVRRLGGCIHIESREAVGTTVRVFLAEAPQLTGSGPAKNPEDLREPRSFRRQATSDRRGFAQGNVPGS